MTTSPMDPIPVPPEAFASRPGFRVLNIGPPAGMTEEKCASVEAFVGYSEAGGLMIADYWRPTPEQLAVLNEGGFVELIQYAPAMVMHSMTVWSAAPD